MSIAVRFVAILVEESQAGAHDSSASALAKIEL
jgi:hypothetical protein